MYFEIFSSGGSPKETWSEENFSKNVDLSLNVQPPKHTFEIGLFFHVLAHYERHHGVKGQNPCFLKKNSSLQVPFGDPPLEKISKDVDFSL